MTAAALRMDTIRSLLISNHIALMSQSGQKLPSRLRNTTSALPRSTDIIPPAWVVRFVPTADVIKEAANCGGLTFSKAASGLC
jgi:hypothetical protein